MPAPCPLFSPSPPARWDSHPGSAGGPGRHGAARGGAEAERQRCVRRPRSPQGRRRPPGPRGASRGSAGLGRPRSALLGSGVADSPPPRRPFPAQVP